jgi:hypothetical protein
MEDGPEEAESRYEYNGRVYRLAERESERWEVFDGETYLGVLIALKGAGTTGPVYTIDPAGADPQEKEATDDWRRALETLIDWS